jgi:hypothetical protein
MEFPAFLEVLEIVAFGYRGGSGAVIVAADAEGFQQAGQVAGTQGLTLTPFIPGAVIQDVEETQEVGGGDPGGVVLGGEGVAQVGEQLAGGVEVFEGAQSEDIDEGLTGALGPFSADAVGDLQEGLGAVLLAGGELGWELIFFIGSYLLQRASVLRTPLIQAFEQRQGLFEGFLVAEAVAGGAGRFGFQGQGDGEIGEGRGKAAIGGKSLGEESLVTVDLEAAPAVLFNHHLSAVPLETGGQDALEAVIDGAVIEKQGADKRIGFALALHLLQQHRGGRGGMEPGAPAQHLKEIEAQGFAGLFVAGVEVEGGGEGLDLEAMGVEGPEGEEVELLGGARQILAVEGDDAIEQGVAFEGRGRVVHKILLEARKSLRYRVILAILI